MRTVPFIEVWNDVVDLHGINPNKEVTPDLARSLARAINKRVDFICKVWPWPEWLLTEERAFRTVWNAEEQYLRVSITDGQPDEVFYLPNTTYYKVNPDADADPPTGTVPTDPTYFMELTPVDTFIAYDQRCKRSIGTVVGIYRQNPRVSCNGNNAPVDFRPSEKGIDVPCGTGPTVFIHYKMPVPSYTIVPYVSGKTYQKGDVTFDPTVGDCFQALAPTIALPADTFYWRRVPFPEVWMGYVTEGAFTDSLMAKDQTGNVDLQARQILAQYHNESAEQEIRSEINVLTEQGQKFYWHYSKPHYHGWYCSQPWNGGTVSTLTDACEDELGWVYPQPTLIPQIAWPYWPDVNSLRTTPVALNSKPTRNLLEKSLAQIVIMESGSRTAMQFELVSGPADPLDPNGQVQPLDYDSNNDKHWSRLT